MMNTVHSALKHLVVVLLGPAGACGYSSGAGYHGGDTHQQGNSCRAEKNGHTGNGKAFSGKGHEAG